jgi:hypothetical protein
MSPSAIQCQTYRIKTAAVAVVVLVVLASWAELYIVSYRQVTDSLY